jgi:hypothetical protein
MEKYDVHIALSPADQKLDIIKVSYCNLCCVVMVSFFCVFNV